MAPTPQPLTTARPALTADLDQAREDLDRLGCCFISGALDAAQAAALAERMLDQAAGERAAGIATMDSGPEGVGVNQRMWSLFNKGREFVDLIDHPIAMVLAEHVFGPEFLLSTISANIANPGGLPMPLHTDQWWMPRPMPRDAPYVRAGSLGRGEYYGPDGGDASRAINPPLMLNMAFYPVDITEEMGATRLALGSHLSGLQPDQTRPNTEGTIAAEAPAGSLVVFDGRIWHGTGANRSDRPRMVLFNTYCGPQIRQQENSIVALLPEVTGQLTDRQKRLLGFRHWNVYGRVGFAHADDVIEGRVERQGYLSAAPFASLAADAPTLTEADELAELRVENARLRALLDGEIPTLPTSPPALRT